MTLSRLLLIAFTTFALVSCDSIANKGDKDDCSQELVVLASSEMPGTFVINGETYGYQYELFSKYASDLGLTLRFIDANELTADQKAEVLKDGVDIITSKYNHFGEEAKDYNSSWLEIYDTEYVVVVRKDMARSIRGRKVEDIVSMLESGKVLLSSGFKSTRSYDMLLDSLNSGIVYLSPRNGFYLMESLRDGQYDFLICEKSESQLGCALVQDVEQIFSFKEKVGVGARVVSEKKDIADGFQQWLMKFRNSNDYAMLNYMYFEHGIVRQFLPNRNTIALGTISAYDDLIREISESAGFDWRFISAIIYKESRFRPFVESHCGAKGLMQIMPEVARVFNVPESEVLKPENNILLGVRLLDKISKSLKFSPSTPEEDRMKILLACYNAGIGHVIDVRRLAVKYGRNPDSWEDISHFLATKTHYLTDEVVTCGKVRSGETLDFVDGVVSRYNSYCALVSR